MAVNNDSREGTARKEFKETNQRPREYVIRRCCKIKATYLMEK